MTDSSYKVGKGKPPREYQFKKGGKGGPGRPKGSRVRSDYEKLLEERIVVGEDRAGRPIRKSWRDVMNRQLLKKAAQGDLHAIRIAKDFELKAAAIAARTGPPAPTAAELRQQEKQLEQRKQSTADIMPLLERFANMRKACVTGNDNSSDGGVNFAPWVMEAIGDYREKHGAQREIWPNSSWSPHPESEDFPPDC